MKCVGQGPSVTSESVAFLREKVRLRLSLQREVYNIPVFLACSFLSQMSLSPQIAVHINLYLTGEE